MRARDKSVRVEVEGRVAENLPSDSIFKSLADASRFFEKGSRGLSVTADPQRLDSIALKTDQWRVEPIDLKSVYSSYFADESRFPAGSAVRSCAVDETSRKSG